MYTFFWNMVFGLAFLLLTAILLLTIQYIYFSDWKSSFEVISIFFLIILYSNLLAKAYLFAYGRLALTTSSE